MLHSRTVLRHAVAARLAGRRDDGTPWTTAGARVLLKRHHDPSGGEELPALLVHGGGEDIAEASYPLAGEAGLIRRTGLLIVDCITAADDGAEDRLDAMAAGVEAALEWFEPPGSTTVPTTLRLLRCDPPKAGSGSVSTLIGRLWVQSRLYQSYRVPPLEGPAP